MLTRSALIWHGFQSRDREGAGDAVNFFSASLLTRGYLLASLRDLNAALS